MSWLGCLLKDSELLVLFAENSQIILKISVIPILLTFIYLVAPNLLKQRQTITSVMAVHIQLWINQWRNIKEKKVMNSAHGHYGRDSLSLL